MNTIEIQKDNHTIKNMIIDYKFKGFDKIVCSGGKIYQLPMQVGRKCFTLKELKQKYHLGSIVYLINSKRVNSKLLKNLAYKTTEYFELEIIGTLPF